MKSIFKRFRDWRQNRKQLGRLEELSSTFATIGKLEQSGFIHWDQSHRRLFIADSLARLMLAHGRHGWGNFLNNVFQYVAYSFLAEKWESRYSVLCAKELSKAKRLTPELTIAETRKARAVAASKMSEADVSLPKLDPFEFYIVSDDDGVAPLQCGVYDPNTDRFDIVNWEEVSGTSPFPSGS